MPRISEIGDTQSAMAGLLKAGLTQLSGDQHITFNLYRKFVSPLDGLVYWVRVLPGAQGAKIVVTGGIAHKTINSGESVQAVEGGIGANGIVSGRIINPRTAADQGMMTKAEPIRVSITGPASQFADAWTTELQPGEDFTIPAAPRFGVWVNAPSAGHKFTVRLVRAIAPLSGQPLTIEQSGSLHYASETQQEQEGVTDANTVVFTSKDEIHPFNEIGPEELYIGERDNIRFAFSSRGHYYEAADLFHYFGHALLSVNKPLIIDNPLGWEPDLFVSNSLPIWLTLPGYVPPYPALMCPFPIYPSFLAPENSALPYASVHVEDTRALGASPWRGRRYERDQLSHDRVTVVIYGASALMAADFMDFVEQHMRDELIMGLMNMPVISDNHQTQVDFRVLSQRKTIEFEVSYLQSASRNMARQVIEKAVCQFYPDLPIGAIEQAPAVVQS